VKELTGWQIPHEVLEHYRFRAVILWKEGKKIKDIAHFFGLHRVTVSNWISAYKHGGEKALKSRKAPGPKPKLTIEEKKMIIKSIESPATEYGFETPLWTCKRIKWLIKEKTGKTLHISNVWRWLRSWNMSPQKPERRAHEFSQEEWDEWMNEVWPEILEKARRWQSVIYFHDECGVSLIAVLGKTWAPKGKRPIVKVTGKKGKICVSSVISKGGRLLFRIEKETVTAKVFIDFLKKLMRHHKHRKIIVITDRAPPHRANAVKKFVEENKRRFALYFFPPYSSHNNPDEKTWGYLKKNKLKTHQAKSVKELRKLTLSGMRSIQRRPYLVESFFHNSFVK